MSHYARQEDIALLDLESLDGRRTYGEDHEWGLLLRERETGRVTGVEVWRASERLPPELLAALPEPRTSETGVEPQSA